MEQKPWESLRFCTSLYWESSALQTGCSGHQKGLGFCAKPGAGFGSHFGDTGGSLEGTSGVNTGIRSEAGLRESLGDLRFYFVLFFDESSPMQRLALEWF